MGRLRDESSLRPWSKPRTHRRCITLVSQPSRNSPIQLANKGLDSPYKKQPRPVGNTFTIRAVALFVHRSEQTIYNVLSKYADHFGEPMYEKVFMPADQRLYRVLSEDDMAVIRDIFCVYVKQKLSPRP